MLGRHGDLSVNNNSNNQISIAPYASYRGALADSYVAGAAREAGSAAELAAARMEDKYSSIDGRYLFEPIAIETLGVYSTSARQLLSDLGRKISQCSGEVRETSFLFQRCSVLVRRFNAVLLYNSLPASDCMD